MDLQIKRDYTKAHKGLCEEFWIICDRTGEVSLCSNAAAYSGIVAGVTNVTELVFAEHIPLLEDAFCRIFAGAEVSVTLECAPASCCDLVVVKSARVLSAVRAQLLFYRNRQEYLAASDAFGDRVGKVFGYIGSAAEELLSVMNGLEAGKFALNDGGLHRAGELARRIAMDSAYFGYATGDGHGGERICDISTLFNRIAEMADMTDALPFSASFENRIAEHSTLCAAEPERIAQIVLMLAAVSARLSDDRSCSLMLSGNDCFAVIEVKCRLKKECEFYGRSENLGGIYRCIHGSPVELMILERLVYVPEWRVEYVADGKGDFVMRAGIVADPNPDSFKFRDATENVADVFRRYVDYAGTFSPDAETEGEDQKNVSDASSVVCRIGGDEEYYSADEQLVR